MRARAGCLFPSPGGVRQRRGVVLTGVTLKINFETQALRQALARLKQNAESLRPALTEIGEYLLEATEDRSAEQVDPVGVFPAYAGMSHGLVNGFND